MIIEENELTDEEGIHKSQTRPSGDANQNFELPASDERFAALA